MGVKLLCTGDVHLGRRPSRLPDCLDPAEVSPTAVWTRTVDEALAHAVDAVVLTGDVVDKDNRYFEAYTPLAREIGRLVDAGIAVYAVAGNHDYDVFTRLAGEIDGFHLLGPDGQWESTVLQRDGQTPLQLIGWSFPAGSVKSSPLSQGLPPISASMPTVGLLHCDVDATANSVYAPVTQSQLAAAGVDAWLLGHIHAPQVISAGGPLIMYPGSPQGLHVNETGPHGPWLIAIEPGQNPTFTQLTLAALRWEHLDVPLDDVSEGEELDLQSAVMKALKGLGDRIAGEASAPPQAVGCRLRLTGRTAIYGKLDALIAELLDEFAQTQTVTVEDMQMFLDPKIDNDALPDIALAERATVADLPGLLARRLLILQNGAPGEDDYATLIREARKHIDASQTRREYDSATYDTLSVSDDELAAALLAAGLSALDAMLAQKEAPG